MVEVNSNVVTSFLMGHDTYRIICSLLNMKMNQEVVADHAFDMFQDNCSFSNLDTTLLEILLE